MIAITLDEDDILRIKGIVIDVDEKEALAFLRERILAPIEQRQNSRMKGGLDGGKGSTL
jgi:hypothetical protein